MATQEPTAQSVFFKPLPEHDNLNTAYFLAKFAERIVVADSGCWEWTGNKVGKGYGRVSFGGRHQIASRLIYRLCIGPIGKEEECCHNCPSGDNPACCNPVHLFKGTHTDNMRDSETKGRSRRPDVRGEKHGSAKLTDADVREIRRRVAAGENGRLIAKDKGVSRATVSEIAHRKKWGHVADEPGLGCIDCPKCGGTHSSLFGCTPRKRGAI